MSKKITLPGSKAYGAATEYMRKKQIYTKADIVTFLGNECGKSPAAALATAVVLLSPREISSRGDCRGNMSNPWGHLAYNDKLNRNKVNGVKEPQKFRFRMRKIAMEPLKRVSGKVAAEKTTTKTEVPVESKAKAETEA